MFKIIVEKECGCFKRSTLESYTEMDSKDDALVKSIEMKDVMNSNFCSKHKFAVKEVDDTFLIVMV